MVTPDPAVIPRPTRPTSGLALTLSGGGYRAALFHLGAVRRLNELGVLSRLDVISSVSGGSILSAVLADRLRPWPKAGEVVPVDAFNEDVADRLVKFCSTNIRTAPVLKRLLPWNWLRTDTAARQLAQQYAEHLSRLTLEQLGNRPRFVFCATDMVFGVNWVFDTADPEHREHRTRIGDYQAGYKVGDGYRVADAVAASSCFPPVFNPLQMHLDPRQLTGGMYRKADRDRLVRAISLTDGGVYDNLGLQPVASRYETILISDGGAVFAPLGRLGRFALIKRIYRYSAIAGRDGGARRRQHAVELFERGERKGTFWGIGTPPSRYATRSEHCYPDDLVEDRIDQVRTDLDRFSEAEQAVLENHGYLQMDAAARTYLVEQGSLVASSIPATMPPHPEWLDPARVRQALERSGKRRLPFGRY